MTPQSVCGRVFEEDLLSARPQPVSLEALTTCVGGEEVLLRHMRRQAVSIGV
jgi:hypothetical protein